MFRFCYITQDTLVCVISNTFYVFYVNPFSVPLSTLTYRTHNTCSIFVTEKALYFVFIMAHVNLTVYLCYQKQVREASMKCFILLPCTGSYLDLHGLALHARDVCRNSGGDNTTGSQ